MLVYCSARHLRPLTWLARDDTQQHTNLRQISCVQHSSWYAQVHCTGPVRFTTAPGGNRVSFSSTVLSLHKRTDTCTTHLGRKQKSSQTTEPELFSERTGVLVKAPRMQQDTRFNINLNTTALSSCRYQHVWVKHCKDCSDVHAT